MLNEEILKYALENGMIDMSYVQEKMEMKEREELLNQHQYEMWQGKDGKWYTYIPDRTKGRILKKRVSREKLENVIVECYKNQRDIYIKDVFEEWINKKIEYGDIKKQTYDRYKTDFARFFNGTEISLIDIRSITEDELEDFIKETIKEKELTNKAFSGLRTLILGIFKHAKRMGLTDISISQFFGDIELSKNIFTKKYFLDEESVFTDYEVELIEKYIKEHPTLINLGILLVFQTGLRTGELSALKKEDVMGNLLNVNKTEIRYRDDDGKYVYDISDSAKTETGNRKVILSSKAKRILKEISRYNPFGEYIFMENGKRIKGRAFSVKLVKICKYLNIRERSIHKGRKTYATKLINHGVDEKIIEKQLGHTSIACTKEYYYFDNKSMKEAAGQLENAARY